MSLKKIVLWEYERGTWQYDLLCALIIAFIFLTPKSWFEREHKTPVATRKVIVKQSDILSEKQQIERRIREITADPNVEVISLKELRNEKGEIFYEVDIK
ncbi:MAG: hypothetical protein D6735_11795 [Acidobacteria bacterium]|nr:MAG: hypothetical protein D6735_11795 [Acidobacteriota bacterium]